MTSRRARGVMSRVTAAGVDKLFLLEFNLRRRRRKVNEVRFFRLSLRYFLGSDTPFESGPKHRPHFALGLSNGPAEGAPANTTRELGASRRESSGFSTDRERVVFADSETALGLESEAARSEVEEAPRHRCGSQPKPSCRPPPPLAALPEGLHWPWAVRWLYNGFSPVSLWAHCLCLLFVASDHTAPRTVLVR